MNQGKWLCPNHGEINNSKTNWKTHSLGFGKIIRDIKICRICREQVTRV